jgi:hypothetical protein
MRVVLNMPATTALMQGSMPGHHLHCCPPWTSFTFRQEEEDEDNGGNNSQERDVGEGTMMMDMATVAMRGATSKDNETGTSSRVVVMAMALPNIS